MSQRFGLSKSEFYRRAKKVDVESDEDEMNSGAQQDECVEFHTENTRNTDESRDLSVEEINNHEVSSLSSGSDVEENEQFDCEMELPDLPAVTVSCLRKKLQHLAVEERCSVQFIRKLLMILRSEGHPDLPMSRATLVQTPRHKISKKVVPPGEYFHFGLEKSLQEIPWSFFSELEQVDVDIGIDGLPLSKSSKLQLWPIMASFSNQLKMSPFVIGAWVGESKPANVNEFLEDFVFEVNGIIDSGGLYVSKEKKFMKFEIRCIVCDAPAKAFLLCVKSHSGYEGCPNCAQICTRMLDEKQKFHMVYDIHPGELRTDESFRSRRDQARHHSKEESGLEKLKSFKTVERVIIDPMHVADLGVTRKMLEFVIEGNCVDFPVTSKLKTSMNNFYLSLAPFMPQKEFNRKPRTFADLTYFKASEFRVFNRYTGFLFAQKFFSEEQYLHFLNFFCAIRALSCDVIDDTLIDFAQNCLTDFVQHYSEFYGPTSITHNVHMLLHLCDNVRLFGNLNSFCAYKFENFLQRIKKTLKKKQDILQQLYNRLEEEKILNEIDINPMSYLNPPKRMKNIEKLYGCGLAYNTCAFGSLQFELNNTDNFCLIDHTTPATIVAFLGENGQSGAFVCIHPDPQPFFMNPINSINIGIMVVGEVDEEVQFCERERITHKCIRFPFEDNYVFVSLLHTDPL